MPKGYEVDEKGWIWRLKEDAEGNILEKVKLGRAPKHSSMTKRASEPPAKRLKVEGEAGGSAGGVPGSVAGGEPESGAGGAPGSVAGGEPGSVAEGAPESGAGGEPKSSAGGAPESDAGGEPESSAGGAPESGAGGEPESDAGGEPGSGAGGAPGSDAGGEPGSGAGGAPGSEEWDGPDKMDSAAETAPAEVTSTTEAAPAEVTATAETAPAEVTSTTEAAPAEVTATAETAPAVVTSATEAAPAVVTATAEAAPAVVTATAEAAPAVVTATAEAASSTWVDPPPVRPATPQPRCFTPIIIDAKLVLGSVPDGVLLDPKCVSVLEDPGAKAPTDLDASADKDKSTLASRLSRFKIASSETKASSEVANIDLLDVEDEKTVEPKKTGSEKSVGFVLCKVEATAEHELMLMMWFKPEEGGIVAAMTKKLNDNYPMIGLRDRDLSKIPPAYELNYHGLSVNGKYIQKMFKDDFLQSELSSFVYLFLRAHADSLLSGACSSPKNDPDQTVVLTSFFHPKIQQLRNTFSTTGEVPPFRAVDEYTMEKHSRFVIPICALQSHFNVVLAEIDYANRLYKLTCYDSSSGYEKFFKENVKKDIEFFLEAYLNKEGLKKLKESRKAKWIQVGPQEGNDCAIYAGIVMFHLKYKLNLEKFLLPGKVVNDFRRAIGKFMYQTYLDASPRGRTRSYSRSMDSAGAKGT